MVTNSKIAAIAAIVVLGCSPPTPAQSPGWGHQFTQRGNHEQPKRHPFAPAQAAAHRRTKYI
jgi:hypothetical protein